MLPFEHFYAIRRVGTSGPLLTPVPLRRFTGKMSRRARMPARSAAFVVTQWNVDCDYAALIADGTIRFIAYGAETCPTTGRAHHQAFIYFHSMRHTGVRSLNKIGKLFGPVQCYVAPMLGGFKDNVEYCSKEGALTKLGDEPAQGARGDIVEAKESILAGTATFQFVVLYYLYIY